MSEGKQRFLTPAKTSLLMVAIGAIALMGIPGVGVYEPPRGSLVGVVVDPGGEAVDDVPVALFDAESLALLEVVHTDPQGRFAFQQAPPVFHVFAHPDLDSGLVGRWRLSLEPVAHRAIELRLVEGHEVTMTVTDDAGHPVEGAEVRAYDARTTHGGSTVVARTLTDADGNATFSCPELAHLGVVGHDHRHLSAWRFDETIEGSGAHYDLTLPAGTIFHGRVVGVAEQPLPGVLVSSWDQRDDGWQWNGYELTDSEGRFDLSGTEGHTVLRAVDLTQSYLPSLVSAERGGRMDVALTRGEPLRIRCTGDEREGVPSRVWVWSDEGNTWSWGTRTDEAGTLQATVSTQHAVVARPLYGAGDTTTEVWDCTYTQGELEVAHDLDDQDP